MNRWPERVLQVRPNELDGMPLSTEPLGDGTVLHRRGTSWAIFSESMTYRYALGRHFHLPGAGFKQCLFVMLNPSTADAMRNDPTIIKCMKFAYRWKCGELVVVNLFAFRSPHPCDLLKTPFPVGPLNAAYVAQHLSAADKVICAWGNGVRNMSGYTAHFLSVANDLGVPLHHLGLTKSGEPKHPMARGVHRIPDEFEPVPWRAL